MKNSSLLDRVIRSLRLFSYILVLCGSSGGSMFCACCRSLMHKPRVSQVRRLSTIDAGNSQLFPSFPLWFVPSPSSNFCPHVNCAGWIFSSPVDGINASRAAGVPTDHAWPNYWEALTIRLLLTQLHAGTKPHAAITKQRFVIRFLSSFIGSFQTSKLTDLQRISFPLFYEYLFEIN